MSQQNTKRDPITGKYVPSATFKLPKVAKRLMRTLTVDADRHHFKNMMIQATLQSQDIPKKEKSDTTK